MPSAFSLDNQLFIYIELVSELIDLFNTVVYK